MENTDSGRKLRAKERKMYIDQEIDEDDIDGRRTYSLEDKLISDLFQANYVQELTGPQFTMKWMQTNGLTRPIVFYDKTGLGLRVPSENFKVSDVKQCVGSRRILDVMDVSTQKAMEMSMKDWVKYYQSPERDRLLNVISLEFCHTRLENYVESPTLIRQLDWVERAWPRHLKERQTESTNVIEKMKYPKVQKYCLMSVAGCYTDFHIDFGGTSVWYHILHGEKIFWLAPPSQKNIDRYVEWTLSAKQGDTFLGDILDQCQRVNLHSGYTFIIPSGWIHAVYTPKDSLVFGGNFLHSFNIENQLLASRVEDKIYVPSKFRYPFLSEMMWYVVDRYVSCLTGRTFLAPYEKDEDDEDEHIVIHMDEDSLPHPQNPDLWLPSRSFDDPADTKVLLGSLEEPSEANLIQGKSPGEDNNQLSHTKHKLARKVASNPNRSWEGGGPQKWVHLTATELKGLKHLVDYLSGLLALPVNKRGVPKDLVDPEGVLREIKQLLENHSSDDQELAVTGEPAIGWPESPRTKTQKLKFSYKTLKKGTPVKGLASSSSSVRRRRTRCRACEACTRSECGECNFCKDMKKFGGPGRMKQTCISRQCMAPVLPSTSVCMICGQEGQLSEENPDDITMSLMECGICWEIVHPLCLHKKFDNLDNEGSINEDLPNSWECSRCCNEGKQGQLKSRIRPGSSYKRTKMEDQRLLADSGGGQDDKTIKSLVNPVEGKRVVSKHGKSTQHGSQPTDSKWTLPPKKFKALSETQMTTEESVPLSPSSPSTTPSPSPPLGDGEFKNEPQHLATEPTSTGTHTSQLFDDEMVLLLGSSSPSQHVQLPHSPREHQAAPHGSSAVKGSPSSSRTKTSRRPKREAFTPQRYRD